MSILVQFGCHGLDNKDASWIPALSGLSDPFAVFSRRNEEGGWVEVLKTEVVDNCLSPLWRLQHLDLREFCGGDDAAPIRVDVYDKDLVSRDDLIGTCTITFAELRDGDPDSWKWELMNAKYLPGGAKPKKGYKNSGILFLADFELSRMLTMKFGAKKLDAKDGKIMEMTGLGTSDPYAVFSREHTDRPAKALGDPFKGILEQFAHIEVHGVGKTFPKVHRTNTVSKCLDPEWGPFEMSELELCCGTDEGREIRVDVYDADRWTEDDLIGSAKITLAELKAGKKEWELVNPAYVDGPKQKEGYKNSGTLNLQVFEIEELPKPTDVVDGLRKLAVADRGFWASEGQLGKDEEKLFSVKSGTDEFNEISAAFKTTLSSKKIVGIERVENGGQHTQFMAKCEVIADKIGADWDRTKMRRLLFHGTSQVAMKSILYNSSSGFQPLLSGDNRGMIWGAGSYFATRAEYSDSGGYVSKNAKGQKQMMVVDVVIGRSIKGSNSQKMIPKLPNDPNNSYDSFSDDKSPPQIYVTQDPTASYPAYVVTYTD